jgi:hypothetical protein
LFRHNSDPSQQRSFGADARVINKWVFTTAITEDFENIVEALSSAKINKADLNMPSPLDDNSDNVPESYYYQTRWCYLTLRTTETAVELVAITASMNLATTFLAEEREKWKMLAKLLYGSPPNQRRPAATMIRFRTISTLCFIHLQVWRQLVN